MVLKIALAVSLVLVSGSLTARHAVGAGTPHRTYSNVALHTVGMWTRTEIDIQERNGGDHGGRRML